MEKSVNDKSIIEYMLDLLSEGEDATAHDENDDGQSAYYRRAAKSVMEFIDEIPGGFLIYEAHGDERIIYANRALQRIFKCDSLAQFMKHTRGSFRGIVHKDDVDRVEKEIEDQIGGSTDALDYVEYRIVRKDGIVRWVEDYGHYINSESSGDFFYVFISDATEKVTRRMVEKATLVNDGRKKEQKLQNIIEEYDKERKLIRQEHLKQLEVIEGLSINYDSILYADFEKNMVLPYRLSVRTERQFDKKLQPRELNWFLEDYVNVWVHPDDREYVRARTTAEFIRKTLSNEDTYYINYRCVVDGEIKHIQLRIVNVGGENVSQAVMGYRNVDQEIVREMEKKELVEAALNKAKLADVAKNTFLSNMSHDMRTPLNAIFGYIALAKKAMRTAKTDNNIIQYLDKIEEAGDQMLDLVDKVLEISYTESQNFSLTDTPCSVSDIVRDVNGSVSRTAAKKRIAIRIDMSAVKHDNVTADRDKLFKILSNLLSNAVKYTECGGSVDVTVTEKKSEHHDIATYSFAVKDTGIGIAKDALDRVFAPFERALTTTESGVFGTGLGLTIAKQYAETMGGNITAESELGKGSTFTATVSLRVADDSEEPEDGEACEFAGKRILIAEDNEINLEIETELLQDLGFITDSACNGQIAYEKVASSTPGYYDLVLMDIQMPVLDGREASRRIRALPDPALASIPIIALSANAFESDRIESLKAGMDAHLTKPVDFDLLSDAMKTALSKRTK